jgi:hypothetical protein
MLNTKIFPSGVATGEAFCNREHEREYLKKCLKNNEHIVLVAPRRYGKTSLISQLIEELGIISISIDLLLAPDPNYILDAVLSGVGDICSEIMKEEASLKDHILAVFADFNPKITLTALGQKIELSRKNNSTKTIAEALLLLEKTAQKAGKVVIFAMDEFQQIALLPKNHTIEASIRHAVERSKNVTYIFSGSNRHLLEQMFDDDTRPLYHLCELMRLDRIKGKDLVSFVGKQSELQWGSSLKDEELELINSLTQRHTYYVNRLCGLLWKQDEKPTEETIKSTWRTYVYSQPWIESDLSRMSANQKSLLMGLTRESTSEIYGKEIRKLTGMSTSSITRVVSSLKKSDVIYVDKGNVYRVLDPAMYYFLSTKTF